MMNEPILSVVCDEPEGEIVRNVRLSQLTVDRLGYLWDKLKDFDVLFNDHVKGNFKAFVDHFITLNINGEFEPAGLLWDVDDVGIFFLNEIIPAKSASAHFVFWDRRFKGREHLCREMLRYIFSEYGLQRIEVKVPVYAEYAMTAVERLGLVKEGRIRNAALYHNKWFDVNIYSAIPLDLARERKSHQIGRTSSRQVCLDCGSVHSNGKKEEIRHGA